MHFMKNGNRSFWANRIPWVEDNAHPAASGQWFNWTIAGCLLLIVLFQGSSAFSEEISADKYPEYADYQRKVARFLGKVKGEECRVKGEELRIED